MKGKKMGMRAVLTRLLGIATVACALVATPAVAEAATTDDIPSNVKIAQTESTNPYLFRHLIARSISIWGFGCVR